MFSIGLITGIIIGFISGLLYVGWKLNKGDITVFKNAEALFLWLKNLYTKK
ncbi:unnamed protein product [marine sediment metagenome]|uniref:Uncharacterized protein n=1 Tax=marine sediment metagenome TaxID=412755 RepID=X0ZQW2_9ZZZZ